MDKKSIQIAATMSLRPKGYKRITYSEQRAQDGDQAFLERSTNLVASGRLVDVSAHCLLDKYEK
ncbi:hypothetical protein EON65_58145 [archaeon]|nr:MAG: hypothetical protein EON65_58145 [archaeon]